MPKPPTNQTARAHGTKHNESVPCGKFNHKFKLVDVSRTGDCVMVAMKAVKADKAVVQ